MYVAASRLGAAAGLGLFAGVAYRRNDAVTCYSGPLVYREQIPPDADTSYVLRLPNSGGKHIDGKPYADSIRSNPRNPRKDGRHFPVEGAKEWTAGAASMCNDPRQQHLYNARITFRKPQGASKALCELVPMRAVLLATRDISPDEEARTPPLPRSPTRRSDSPSRAADPRMLRAADLLQLWLGEALRALHQGAAARGEGQEGEGAAAQRVQLPMGAQSTRRRSGRRACAQMSRERGELRLQVEDAKRENQRLKADALAIRYTPDTFLLLF